MHSGASTFNYPFELPTGPSGFQPKLELIYNSGSVDEMKNKRAVGSWVGIAWTLSLGSISFDPVTWAYTIDLNGVSYALVQDGSVYRTNPDEYLNITRNGNTWEVWDKDGNYYRFGGTTDSQQYLPNSIYYRWDLSLQKDTNNNQAMISYVRDITGTSPNTWVRSAYPDDIMYGNFQVHFCSSLGRQDNPQATTYNPAPEVIEMVNWIQSKSR